MKISEFLRCSSARYIVERVLLELTFNPQSFLTRLQSVVTLAQRGATEGEKAASRAALERMIDRGREEAKNLPPADAKNFLSQLDRISASSSAKEPPQQTAHKPQPDSEPDTSIPKYKTGMWIYDTQRNLVGKIADLMSYPGMGVVYIIDVPGSSRTIGVIAKNARLARQDEIDAALAKKTSSGAQSNTPDEWQIIKLAWNNKNGSDKVYGVAQKGNIYINFWGKRTGSYRVSGALSKESCFASLSVKTSSRGYVRTEDRTMLARATTILKQAKDLPR